MHVGLCAVRALAIGFDRSRNRLRNWHPETMRQTVAEVAPLQPDVIQVDDPARDRTSGAELAEFHDEATADTPSATTLALHICFDNNMGRPRFRRSFFAYFPDAPRRRARQFVLEFANRELAAMVQGAEIVRRELESL